MDHRSWRILIVDDDRANRKILQKTFEEQGFVVMVADCVDVAQATLCEPNVSVDLVLSDIQMPGKTGFDLVRWVKNESRLDVPILLITSQLPEPENRIIGLSLGAVDYVLRSLDSRELVLRVKLAIEHFEQLRSLRSTLQDSEEIAGLGQLLAATNHEIGNLAQIAVACSSFLARRLNTSSENDTQLLRVLGSLQSSTTMLADVSKSMGSMIGKQPTPVKLVNLTIELRSVLEMSKPLLKNCYVEDNLANGPDIWVHGSTTHIKQIVINLLLNARDALREMTSPNGGEVKLQLKQCGNSVEIHVVDNGVGLDEAQEKTEFRAFESTKHLRGGKGLGLWLSSKFAKDMGGSLTLISDGPGKGCDACLALNLAKAPANIDVAQFLEKSDLEERC